MVLYLYNKCIVEASAKNIDNIDGFVRGKDNLFIVPSKLEGQRNS